MFKAPDIDVRQLTEAGVHFGHTTACWNPKMEPYIYGSYNKIHIINLNYTIRLLECAMKKMYEVSKNNGRILFLGTKEQASELIKQYAIECGQHYVNHRWLGGMLTNWHTIQASLRNLDNIESLLSDEKQSKIYTKKELLDLTRSRDKILRSLGGIRKIDTKPDLIVIVDTNRESIAIKEAKKLGIPTIGIVDTNSDPDSVSFPIPANDDGKKSITLICSYLTQAVISGIEDSLTEMGVEIDEGKSGLTSDDIKKLHEHNKKLDVATTVIESLSVSDTNTKLEKSSDTPSKTTNTIVKAKDSSEKLTK